MDKPKNFKNVVLNTLFSILLLALFPPISREFYSEAFKIGGGIIIFIVYIIFLLDLYKNKIKYKIRFPEIIIFFFFPFIYSIYGLIVGNNLYDIFKEFFFFSFPLVVIFIVENLFEGKVNIVNLIVNFSLIVAIMQLLYGIYGIVFFYTNRYYYRCTYVLLSTPLICLGFILSLSKISTLKNLFSFRNLLFVLSLIITMGRTELVFLFIIITYFIFSKIIGKNKSFLLYSFIMLVSPLLYLLFLLKKGYSIKDTSTMWRFIEWASFLHNLHINKFLFLGNGFGAMLKTLTHIHLFTGQTLCYINRFHNLWLYLLFKTGIIGLTFFLLMIFLLLYLNKEKKSKLFLFLYLEFIIFISSNVTGSFTMSISSGSVIGLILTLMHKKVFFMTKEKISE